MNMKEFVVGLVFFWVVHSVVFGNIASAESVSVSDEISGHDENTSEVLRFSKKLQSLKSDVVLLNKDLKTMEEKLLFPSSTRLTMFVSASSGEFFQLDSVKVKLGGRLVASKIYSKRQQQALLRGGVHQLFITNLSEGDYEGAVFFSGIGPEGRTYKRAKSIKFTKGPGSEFLEIRIGDNGATQEPQFELLYW